MVHLIIHEKPQIRNEYLKKVFLQGQFRLTEQDILNHKLVPDLHLIHFNNISNIGIDEIRSLFKKMIYRPINLSKQVAVIYHAHNLTIEAQNAMLKPLEDDINNIYILLTNNTKNLLSTIVSRCELHYVKDIKSSTQPIDYTKPPKPKILTMPLHEQFDTIEKLVETDRNGKDKSEEINNPTHTITINQLLLQCNLYFKSILEKSIEKQQTTTSNKMQKAIGIIETATKRLAGNSNKRLTLENMVLQLNSLT